MTIEQAIITVKADIKAGAKKIDALKAQESARKKLINSLKACEKYNPESVIASEVTIYESVRSERIALEQQQSRLNARLKDLNRMDANNKRIAAEERKRISTARCIGERIRKRDLNRYERQCAAEAFEHAESIENGGITNACV